MSKITESDSHYNDLEHMPVHELLFNINREDHKVAVAVSHCIGQIEKMIPVIVEKMKTGGRMFYVGAGTSGRLGIVDASECPPTYGIEHGRVLGIIAGGDTAIRKAVEFAEDSLDQGWLDLKEHHIHKNDFVIGITASGHTPYVLGTLNRCNEHGIETGCIVCNEHSEVAAAANYPVECLVGPEFVTGSTRMKSGTAQKLILNMISTAVMIGLGRVKGNKMVDMQLSNNKLVNRGIKMLINELQIDETTAARLLEKHGSVRSAIKAAKQV